MAEQIGHFSVPDARRIARHIQRFGDKTPSLGRRHRRRATPSGSASILIEAPVNGIPARVGTRAGKATCTVLTTIMTGDEADIITTAETLIIYNSVTLAVLANGERIGHASLHDDGLWWANVGDCNDEVNP